jgi:hypothetical protein
MMLCPDENTMMWFGEEKVWQSCFVIAGLNRDPMGSLSASQHEGKLDGEINDTIASARA